MADYNNDNKGVAFRNDYRKEDKHPNWKGKGNFNGQDFDIAIWERTGPKGQFFSISFSEPYVKKQIAEDMQDKQSPQSGYEKAKAIASSLKTEEEPSPINLDDIPF